MPFIVLQTSPVKIYKNNFLMYQMNSDQSDVTLESCMVTRKKKQMVNKVSDKAAMLPFLEGLVLLHTTVEELSIQAQVLSQSLFLCTKECSVSAFLLPQLRSSPEVEMKHTVLKCLLK